MLWTKTLHIVFIAGWFAGPCSLPRNLVNLALVPAGSSAERERLLQMVVIVAAVPASHLPF